MSLEAYEALVESYREVRHKVREMECSRDFHLELSDLANRTADTFRAKGIEILNQIVALEKQLRNPIRGDE